MDKTNFIYKVIKELYKVKEKYEKKRNYWSNYTDWGRDKKLREDGELTSEDGSLEAKIEGIDHLIYIMENLEDEIAKRIAPYLNNFDENLMHYVLYELDKTERKKLKAAIQIDDKKRYEAVSRIIRESKEALLSKIIGGHQKPIYPYTKKEAKKIERLNQETRDLNSITYASVIELINLYFIEYFEGISYKTRHIAQDGTVEYNKNIVYTKKYDEYCKEHVNNYFPTMLVKKCDYLLENAILNNSTIRKIERYKAISIELEKTKYLIEKIEKDLHVGSAYSETKKVLKEVLEALRKQQQHLEGKLSRLNINIEELYKKQVEKDKKISNKKFIETQKIEKPKAIVVEENVANRADAMFLNNMRWQEVTAKEMADREFNRVVGRTPTDSDRRTPKYLEMLEAAASNLKDKLEEANRMHKEQLIAKLKEKAKKDIMLVTKKKEISDEEFEQLIVHANKTPNERYAAERESKGKTVNMNKFLRKPEKYADSKCDSIVKKYLEEVEKIRGTNYLTQLEAKDLMDRYDPEVPMNIVNHEELDKVHRLGM